MKSTRKDRLTRHRRAVNSCVSRAASYFFAVGGILAGPQGRESTTVTG